LLKEVQNQNVGFILTFKRIYLKNTFKTQIQLQLNHLLIKKIVSLTMIKSAKFSNVKVIHNTEFADTENVNETSQLVDNKDNKIKVVDIAEVIDKAEVVDIVEVIDKVDIFDTVNAISTVEDTDNQIIILLKINKEHDTDCSVSDSSYVIDLIVPLRKRLLGI